MAENNRETSDTDGLRRIKVHFTGQVQGVGFRWTSQRLATQLGLAGWAHNEWDGTVKMELQGPNERIKQFFGLLQNQYSRWHIDYRIANIDDIPVDPDDHDFIVRLHGVE